MKYRIRAKYHGNYPDEFWIQSKESFFSKWKEESWHSFPSLEEARNYINDKQPRIIYYEHPEEYDYYGF